MIAAVDDHMTSRAISSPAVKCGYLGWPGPARSQRSAIGVQQRLRSRIVSCRAAKRREVRANQQAYSVFRFVVSFKPPYQLLWTARYSLPETQTTGQLSPRPASGSRALRARCRADAYCRERGYVIERSNPTADERTRGDRRSGPGARSRSLRSRPMSCGRPCLPGSVPQPRRRGRRARRRRRPDGPSRPGRSRASTAEAGCGFPRRDDPR